MTVEESKDLNDTLLSDNYLYHISDNYLIIWCVFWIFIIWNFYEIYHMVSSMKGEVNP